MDLRSDSYDIKNLCRRLAQKEDSWKGLDSRRVRLSQATERLDEPAGLKELEQ